MMSLHTIEATILFVAPNAIIFLVVFAAGEILSTVSHIMVPNPTKTIVAETQSRLTDIVHELQRNLSKLTAIMKDDDYRTPSSVGRYGPVVDVVCIPYSW